MCEMPRAPARLPVGKLAGQVNLAAVHAAQPSAVHHAAQHLQQLGLPIAGHARNAQDLAGADVQRHHPSGAAPRRHRAPTAPQPPAPARRAGRGPCRPAATPCGPPSTRPDLCGLVSAVLTVAVISPRRITLTVSVISMISRSLWVIRMIVLPSAFSRSENAEKVIGLGRGQHAGRLVQGSGYRPGGRAPSGFPPAAGGPPPDPRSPRRGRPSARIPSASSVQKLLRALAIDGCSSAPSSAPRMTFSTTEKF